MPKSALVPKDPEKAIIYLGFLLLILFCLWVAKLWKKRNNKDDLIQEIKESTKKTALTFIGCFGAMVLVLGFLVILGRYVL